MVEHINGVHVWCTYRCERHGIRSKVNWNDSEIRFRLSAPIPWVHSMSALTDEFGKSQTKWPVWIAYVHGKRVVNRSECLIDAFALTSHSNLFMSANEVRWTCHFMILVFCIVRYALVQWRYFSDGIACSALHGHSDGPSLDDADEFWYAQNLSFQWIFGRSSHRTCLGYLIWLSEFRRRSTIRFQIDFSISSVDSTLGILDLNISILGHWWAI